MCFFLGFGFGVSSSTEKEKISEIVQNSVQDVENLTEAEEYCESATEVESETQAETTTKEETTKQAIHETTVLYPLVCILLPYQPKKNKC